MEWIGIQCIGIHCMPLGTSPRPGALPGQTQRGAGGFHYNPVNAINHPEVRTMPSCIACGAQLEPPVRVPHTVYVKTLYRIAGQDYCRHHVIRAAVVAGVSPPDPVAPADAIASSGRHDTDDAAVEFIPLSWHLSWVDWWTIRLSPAPR